MQSVTLCPPDYTLPSSSVLVLPQYTPSSASPLYAAEPSEDEQRLDFVARNSDRIHHGAFTTRVKNVTITLANQDPAASMPTYVRNALVGGELQIDGEENVLAVSMKLEGRQTTTIAEGGSTVHRLFSVKSELWKKGDTATCPSILPFAINFPSSYKYGKEDRVVPPSFSAAYHGVPGLVAKNVYTLVVRITKPRLGSWKQTKTVSIPVCYAPRSRPFLPICPSLQPFFSTVKQLPGEWAQVDTTMPSRDEAYGALDCHLFIPAVQIYGIPDTIPFHLQLRGPDKSLRTFLNSSSSHILPQNHKLGLGLRHTRSSTSTTSSTSESSRSTLSRFIRPHSIFGALPRSALAKMGNAQPVVRVFLLRQVTVKVNFQKAWRSTVIGEGTLSPVPRLRDPSESDDESLDGHEAGAEPLETLDWEGEVRCNEDVNVGGFSSGDVTVKDFIVVHLCPPNPETSPLTEHQYAHPIRIVTDTYREIYDYSIVN